MTLPRQIIPGSTYFITRRCTQRCFLLKPKALTNQIFLYCIAVAAKKYGVIVHVAAVMSNHWNVIATDPDGHIAEFYGWVHEYVAKAVNASYGLWENLWSSEKTSVIRLGTRKDIMSKALYILANPVVAELVAKGSKWPGVWLYRRAHSRTVNRPSIFFRKDGEIPESVQLQIEPPPQFSSLKATDYEETLSRNLERKELKVQARMEQEGRSFLGAQAVVGQHHLARPKSREKRRELNPRIAGKSKWYRIEAIQRQQDFIFKYRKAFQRWRQGIRDVVFPFGTYALRVYAGAKCEPG